MSSDREVAEAGFVRDSMLQHSMALTMAEVCGHHTQLLTQDPDYTTEAKERLEGKGFSVIGQFGAGGFAEINNTSVVFSVFVEAPRKQIVADIARPLLIITTGFEVLNDSEKPWADADSPRTQAMWEEYDRFSFPISSEDQELMKKLKAIYIYVKKMVDRG